MQIGILGSGEVGQKLADGFIAIGFTVDRHAQPGKSRAADGKARRQGFYRLLSDAATFGEIVVLATYWEGMPSALQLAQVKNFSG